MTKLNTWKRCGSIKAGGKIIGSYYYYYRNFSAFRQAVRIGRSINDLKRIRCSESIKAPFISYAKIKGNQKIKLVLVRIAFSSENPKEFQYIHIIFQKKKPEWFWDNIESRAHGTAGRPGRIELRSTSSKLFDLQQSMMGSIIFVLDENTFSVWVMRARSLIGYNGLWEYNIPEYIYVYIYLHIYVYIYITVWFRELESRLCNVHAKLCFGPKFCIL